MAKTNKYASINFNDIYEKKKPNTNNKPSSSSLSSSSPTTIATSSTANLSRIHGRMLVLTRPSSPKPQPQPISPLPQTPKSAPALDPHQPRPEPDSIISLRPLGTLSSPSTQVPVSLKPDPFVPPHLRPGFAGREERFKGQNGNRRASCEMDLRRPSSSGNRSGSSGGGAGGSYASSSSSHN